MGLGSVGMRLVLVFPCSGDHASYPGCDRPYLGEPIEYIQGDALTGD